VLALPGVLRGVATGLWFAALGLAIAWLHGLRAGFCDPVEGSQLFVLGPGCGAVMGGVWGALAGLVAAAARSKRRRVGLAIGLAALGPIAGIVVSLVRFYTSPMVFAFDPFFGFFAGTLYDSIISGMDRLASYRAGSAATCLGIFAGAALLRRDGTARERPLLAVVCALALSASAVHAARGTKLGHYQTAGSIREALGRTLTSARCELVYPVGTPEIEAAALARECDGHVRQLERFFELPAGSKITVFLFANPDQKGVLMGAATTYIAKPWRREIYIQRNGFPHPVMRHELAHVVAGGFGAGPFHVAGPLRGLVPDPGRIEGVAVAAATQEDELSPDDWAKAMKELSLLPPLSRVFKLSFLGEPSSRAYVVAGAFVAFIRREHGVGAVRAWYGGASLESVTSGLTLAQLEKKWLAALDRLEVPDDLREVARARFDQPAIFGRRCPHVVDRLAEEAAAALSRFDTERARKLYRELLELDPHDVGARLGLGTCALREGRVEPARAAFAAVAADPTLGRTVRARAVETLGDLSLSLGDGADATARYDEVAKVVVDSDRLRTLDVKRYAAAGGGQGAVTLHLTGEPRYGRDATRAAAALGAWAVREPALGLADYLIARLHTGSGRFDLAAENLDRATLRELPLSRVAREALRLRVVAACAMKDDKGVLEAHEKWKAQPGLRAKEQGDMLAFVERCLGTPGAALTPAALTPATLTPATLTPATLTPATTVPDAPESCPDGMVRIPGATAFIGSPRGQGVDDEWPRYRTPIASFCLDEAEATAAEYARCVAAGKCTASRGDRVTCSSSRDDQKLPMNCVDFHQAAAACAFRGARLPTEAEWEYAATGGDARAYSWGDQSPNDRACWKHAGACPVKSYPPGAFGLFDMTGNLWEWTSDAYGDYPFPPREAPLRVYRGGSWSRRFEKWMRARLRNRAPPDFEGSHLGFRCAVTSRGTPCAAGSSPDGGCLHTVLAAECRPGKTWNGSRCAADAAPGCGEGRHFVPGHGCERDVPPSEPSSGPLDVVAVRRIRSPEFDADCGRFQAARPNSYRFEGGSHAARNAVESGARCKNRDVGVGWNSACCP
jgi:formylglycine-generating enzyme required for sulfatase activity